MTKITLTYTDRINMTYSLFDGKGDVLTLRALRDLLAEVKTTDQEDEEHGLKITDGGMQWKNGETAAEYEIKDSWQAVIRAQLEKRNAAKDLSLSLLPLYDLFVMPEDKPVGNP